jgi:hypothetical protein
LSSDAPRTALGSARHRQKVMVNRSPELLLAMPVPEAAARGAKTVLVKRSPRLPKTDSEKTQQDQRLRKVR